MTMSFPGDAETRNYVEAGHTLAARILALIPTHPEIMGMTDPWPLLKIPEFEYEDVNPSSAQAAWALRQAQYDYAARLDAEVASNIRGSESDVIAGGGAGKIHCNRISEISGERDGCVVRLSFTIETEESAKMLFDDIKKHLADGSLALSFQINKRESSDADPDV